MEISIKKPCHENWEAMTPNEQGAFCSKCVKTVIDFSNKSIDEIKEFFVGKQNGNVCGRFQKKQLTALSFDSFFKEFKLFNLTKRFAVIVYFTFGMWLFGNSSAMAQTSDEQKGEVQVKPEPQIMGGIRAIQKQDTSKTCAKPYKTVNKKAIRVQPVTQEKPKLMGEVSALPEPKEKPKPKPKSK